MTVSYPSVRTGDASVIVERRPLVQPFQVSHLTTETVDIVRLRLWDAEGGPAGDGEISADAGYGQDGPAIADEARAMASVLLDEPGTHRLTRLVPRLTRLAGAASAPARMLVEMAFLDRAARCAGRPPWQLLGLPDPGRIRLMHTVPIGAEIPAGLRPLKIKLGGPDDADVLRRLAGVPGPIILDVNCGWSEEDWAALRPLVARVAPAVLEDPVNDPVNRPELIADVRAALPATAVILDEGIGGGADVERAAALADGANIKVMKMGGLLPSIEALRYLAGKHATRMLGCFLEPPRSIAYAAQLAGLCDWTDLDGHFWLSDHAPAMEYRLDSSGPGIPRIEY
jgi:L-alanine-DL-glutamate epimerase-like enolase superfamily enzyme